MSAYDNPKAVVLKIDAAANQINNFNRAMSASSANLAKQAQIKKAKLEKIEKEKELKEGRALKDFDKVMAGILASSDDIELGSDQKTFSDKQGAVFQNDSIRENLEYMREEFLSKIRDTDSASEISRLQGEYFGKVSNFKLDVDNFVAGFRVYEQFKDLPAGEKDAIMNDPSFEFSSMIPIYKSLSEGKGNVGIVPSSNGKGFTVAEFEQDANGNFKLDQTTEPTSLTKYRQYAQKDPENLKFFNQVKEYTPQGGSNAFIQRIIQDFPGGYQYKDASGAPRS